MKRFKVTLSIGFPTATHEDVIEIEDDEWHGCETEDDRQNLMQEYWVEWSNNYIDGGFELIEQNN